VDHGSIMLSRCSLLASLEAFAVPIGRLTGINCEEFYPPDTGVLGRYMNVHYQGRCTNWTHLRAEAAGPRQPSSISLKASHQVQKCIPTVTRTMWLRKSYVPLAVCPPTDGLGLNGGVLPVTVWSGPYPNW